MNKVCLQGTDENPFSPSIFFRSCAVIIAVAECFTPTSMFGSTCSYDYISERAGSSPWVLLCLLVHWLLVDVHVLLVFGFLHCFLI